jgi:hypothetical protein
MDLQKRTDPVSQPWNLDLTIDDVMADLDPGTLVWRERVSARQS